MSWLVTRKAKNVVCRLLKDQATYTDVQETTITYQKHKIVINICQKQIQKQMWSNTRSQWGTSQPFMSSMLHVALTDCYFHMFQQSSEPGQPHPEIPSSCTVNCAIFALHPGKESNETNTRHLAMYSHDHFFLSQFHKLNRCIDITQDIARSNLQHNSSHTTSLQKHMETNWTDNKNKL